MKKIKTCNEDSEEVLSLVVVMGCWLSPWGVSSLVMWHCCNVVVVSNGGSGVRGDGYYRVTWHCCQVVVTVKGGGVHREHVVVVIRRVYYII